MKTNTQYDDLIYAFDLLTWLDSENVQYWASGKNVSRDWVGIRHNYGNQSCEDPSNHMGVHRERKNFTCWRCGHKGGLFSLIKEIAECNFPQAVEIAGKYQQWNVPVPINPDIEKTPFSLPEEATDHFQNPHIDYLDKRGYNPDTVIPRYNLHATDGTSKHWPWKIIIPIYRDRQQISFVGMGITENDPIRYRFCPNSEARIERKKLLYGIDDVRDKMILVEGILDQWRIGPGSVATLSIQWTQDQLETLLKHPAKEIYIAFDGEDLAMKKAQLLGDALAFSKKHIELIHLPNGEDPDSLDDDSVFELQKLVM